MNARYLRKTAKDLNNYQKRVILSLALREKDDLPTRAKHLKKLAYCTDEAKFEVLKESDTVSEGLYDSLYELYFGTVQEDEPDVGQDTVQDTVQDSEQDVGQGEQPGKEKRSGHHNKAWTHSECVRLIEGYNQGLTHKQLAEMFGVSCAAASQRLVYMRRDSQYSGLFTSENIDAKAGRPGTHYKFWTGEKCENLIKAYKQGLPLESIGELFGVSKVAVIQKLGRLRKDDRFRALFADEQEEPKTAEPVTVSQEEMPQKKVGLPKAFTATGTGLLTVEDGLKLDGEPLLTMLRQEIVKKGMEQFYAAVEIVIRPVEPKGMVVTTEEEE